MKQVAKNLWLMLASFIGFFVFIAAGATGWWLTDRYFDWLNG